MKILKRQLILLQAILAITSAAQAGNLYYYPSATTSRLASNQTLSVSAYDAGGQLVPASAGNVSFSGSGPVRSGQLYNLTVPAAGQYSFSFEISGTRYWTGIYTLTASSGTYYIQGSFPATESFTNTAAPIGPPTTFPTGIDVEGSEIYFGKNPDQSSVPAFAWVLDQSRTQLRSIGSVDNEDATSMWTWEVWELLTGQPRTVMQLTDGGLTVNGYPVLTTTGADASYIRHDATSIAITYATSISIGEGSHGSTYGATAMGVYSTASGNGSTAMGSSLAVGDYATATGGSWADGYAATSSGGASAWGDFATALGSSFAEGIGSTALGGSTASGDYSTATGSGSHAIGDYSTAAGSFTVAPTVSQFVIGQFNLSQGGNATVWDAADELFTIGNGVDEVNRSNALVVKKNAGTAIGTGVTSNAAAQIVVGKYNDTTVDAVSNRQEGVFIVGAGNGTDPGQPKNALRVTPGGIILIHPRGDLPMGGFEAGQRP